MHMRFHVRYLLGFVGLVGIFIVACGGSAPSAAPTAAATQTPPTVAPNDVAVAVTPAPEEPTSTPATAEQIVREPSLAVFKVTDRSIEAPEFIPAGLTTIRMLNEGSVEHGLTLVLVNSDRSADELVSQLKNQDFSSARRIYPRVPDHHMETTAIGFDYPVPFSPKTLKAPLRHTT